MHVSSRLGWSAASPKAPEGKHTLVSILLGVHRPVHWPALTSCLQAGAATWCRFSVGRSRPPRGALPEL